MSGMDEVTTVIRRHNSDSKSNRLTNGHSSPFIDSDKNNNKDDKLNKNVEKKLSTVPPTLLPKPIKTKLNNLTAVQQQQTVIDDIQNLSRETIEGNQNKNGKDRNICNCNEATARADNNNECCCNETNNSNECNHSRTSNDNTNGERNYFFSFSTSLNPFYK